MDDNRDDVIVAVLNGQYTQFRVTDAMGQEHTLTLDRSHMVQVIRAIADRMAVMEITEP